MGYSLSNPHLQVIAIYFIASLFLLLFIYMKKKNYTREQFDKLMEDYKSGKKGIQPGHPDEIKQAIQTFLDFSLILTEYPEIDSIPPEIINNLLDTLCKYPEYNKLTLELVDILNRER